MIPKFRAWDKEHDEMLYPDDVDKIYFEITVDGIVTYDMRNVLPYDDIPPYLDTVIMQSTGLRDKNGKEIFEGDILHVWIEDEYIPNRDSGGGIIDYDCESGFSQIGKVEFEGSSFDYNTVKTLSGKHEEIYLPIGWLSNYEVLGNIHEHSYFLYKNEKGDY